MCGIAGIISTEPVSLYNLKAMSMALRHRGPDGYGYMLYPARHEVKLWINEEPSSAYGSQVGFAHRRLAIIDLAGNNSQPMYDDSQRCCITYNGEVYNYIELREELRKKGYTFRTEGDVEVVLKSYLAWGTDCFQRFNGMWALAILDSYNQRVVLSRDRFGIKPLYTAEIGKALYFASEIKGLLAAQKFEPNDAIIKHFQKTTQVDIQPQTFFKGIEAFPPATFMEIDLSTGQEQAETYWSYPTEQWRGNEIETFSSLFFDAVKLHSRSDVPIGTCLSGGLDSSSLVCVAELLRKQGLISKYTHQAFGYVASDEQWSEKKYMEKVAEKVPAKMNYIQTTLEQAFKAIPEVIWCQDEPFGSASILVQWFVFQRAKAEGMKVMLDGQGADESLAGYPPFIKILHGNTRSGLKARVESIFHYKYNPPLLQNTLLAYMKSLCLPAILRHEDRNSMYFSIESRVPFLDYRLIEFAFSLPDRWKIRNDVTKYILRESMSGIIPEEIRTRKDKIGFKAAPSITFEYIKSNLNDLVVNKTEYEKMYFDEAKTRELFCNAPSMPMGDFIAWQNMNLKLWLRKHWG